MRMKFTSPRVRSRLPSARMTLPSDLEPSERITSGTSSSVACTASMAGQVLDALGRDAVARRAPVAPRLPACALTRRTLPDTALVAFIVPNRLILESALTAKAKTRPDEADDAEDTE